MRPILALSLLLVTGCAGFRERFPSHAEVYVPVPVTLGSARLVGGDTSWVLTEAAYELVVPRRDLLPDAKRALDDAAEEYRKIFGAQPARVTVALREWRERDEARDSTRQAEGAPDAAGAEVIALALPRPMPRERASAMARRLPLAPVARAWLAAHVDQRSGAPRLRSTWAPGAVPADDPRLPDWLEDGVVQVIAASPAREYALVRLARQPGDLLPLRELFSSRRPALTRDELEERDEMGRGADPLSASPRALLGRDFSPAQRFAAESYGVARFLAEREGPEFLGRLVDRVIAGDAVVTAIGAATQVPADVEALDAAWRKWLEEDTYGTRR